TVNETPRSLGNEVWPSIVNRTPRLIGEEIWRLLVNKTPRSIAKEMRGLRTTGEAPASAVSHTPRFVIITGNGTIAVGGEVITIGLSSSVATGITGTLVTGIRPGVTLREATIPTMAP